MLERLNQFQTREEKNEFIASLSREEKDQLTVELGILPEAVLKATSSHQ